MLNLIKKIISRIIIDNDLIGSISRSKLDVESINQQFQRVIVNQYKQICLNNKLPYKMISESGFRCYSQFEEDGIILYILSIIGMKTKKVVEICCGDGSECMATNLILNHGYDGFLFDGDSENIKRANDFFTGKKDCLLTPPKLKHAWITKDNINHLLSEINVSGEVDLLSLDIDGNDYYIWEAISEINPRLCVFETHNVIPGDLSLTIPYSDQFNCWDKVGFEQDFRSVSLLAMNKLSQNKGYRLIGGHRHGFNVFFLRNDINIEQFPEVSIKEIHDNLWTKKSQEERWPLVKKFNWINV